MAFFGLTALGPQNCFQVSLLDFSYLDVFTVGVLGVLSNGNNVVPSGTVTRHTVFTDYQHINISQYLAYPPPVCSLTNQDLDVENAFNRVDHQKRTFIRSEQVSTEHASRCNGSTAVLPGRPSFLQKCTMLLTRWSKYQPGRACSTQTDQ